MKSRRELQRELAAIIRLLSTHGWTAEERILAVLATHAMFDGRVDRRVSCDELVELSGFDHDAVEMAMHRLSSEGGSE